MSETKVVPSWQELLREVMDWHSNHYSSDYCECDKSPCAWCEYAQAALAAAPNTAPESNGPAEWLECVSPRLQAPNTEPDTNSAQISSTLVDGPELARLERGIAGWFVTDWREQFCDNHGWFDTTTRTSKQAVRVIRYVELLGLLHRHPTDANLVRVKEQS